MPHPDPPARALRGAWRAGRVIGLGGASLLLATAAHTSGGGTLPSAGVLAVTAYVLGLLAVPLTARRCRPGVLLAVLAVQQLVLHELFALTADPGVCLPTPGSAMHHLAMSCLPSGAGAMAMGSGAGMWISHGLATLATAWLLARGEAWLWRAAGRIVEVATAAPTRTTRRRRPQPGPLALVQLQPIACYSPSAPRAPPVPR